MFLSHGCFSFSLSPTLPRAQWKSSLGLTTTTENFSSPGFSLSLRSPTSNSANSLLEQVLPSGYTRTAQARCPLCRQRPEQTSLVAWILRLSIPLSASVSLQRPLRFSPENEGAVSSLQSILPLTCCAVHTGNSSRQAGPGPSSGPLGRPSPWESQLRLEKGP